jgi:hypothetical protein
MRVDLYTLIHKAQRYHLFRLSNEMGRADYSDAAAAAAVYAGLRHLIDHLRDHAKNEETYIHPLFAKLGTKADTLNQEHHDLESELDNLEKLADKKEGKAVYSAYARFLGIYLIHLDEEEKAQAEILWPNYKDEDLAAVFGRFKAERAPAAAKADLEFMLPALSVAELAGMFRGMKASAPAPAFQGACDLAAKTLDAATWKQVSANLS